MINEPVALMTEYGIKPLYEGALQEGMFLYTHPAKTLTDEEIWKELTTVKHTWIATTSVWFEFEKEELTKAIRAILKKANNG